MRLTEIIHFLSKKNLTSEEIRLSFTHYEPASDDWKCKAELQKGEIKHKKLALF